jgi:hypothetical protein
VYRNPEKVSNVSDALKRSKWRGDAACGDWDDPDAFFPEPHSGARGDLSNPRELETNLLCVGCPVRKGCLTEALTPIVVFFPGLPPSTMRATGTWAATAFSDRQRLRRLSVAEAAERLEAELPERLRQRIEAFERRHPDNDHPGCTGKRCRRARVMLDDMRGARSSRASARMGSNT